MNVLPGQVNGREDAEKIRGLPTPKEGSGRRELGRASQRGHAMGPVEDAEPGI